MQLFYEIMLVQYINPRTVLIICNAFITLVWYSRLSLVKPEMIVTSNIPNARQCVNIVVRTFSLTKNVVRIRTKPKPDEVSALRGLLICKMNFVEWHQIPAC